MVNLMQQIKQEKKDYQTQLEEQESLAESYFLKLQKLVQENDYLKQEEEEIEIDNNKMEEENN